MDAGMWIVPAARMKMKTEHLVPLSPQSIAILAELKEIGAEAALCSLGVAVTSRSATIRCYLRSIA